MANCDIQINKYNFSDKTAIVTGSSSGIGLACVKALLEQNIENIVVTSFIDEENVPDFQILQNTFKNSDIIYIKCDVRNKDDMKNLFDQTIETFGGLDIVVNNAGTFNETSWSQTIDINLKGTILGTELALQYMSKENGGPGGTIINTSSLLGFAPMAAAPVYAATKHAIIGYTKSISMPFHFNKTGVRIMALCPGLTDTGLFQEGMKIAKNNPTPMMLEWLNEISTYKPQEPSYPAKCLIRMLTEGKNSSIWMSINEEIYEIKYPEFSSFERV